MSYLIFISCFITSVVIGFRWGAYHERRKQIPGRLALLSIGRKYVAALSERSNN